MDNKVLLILFFVLGSFLSYGQSSFDNAPCKATFPNVFSPNNDGVNDLLEFTCLDVADYRLDVYNNWGERLSSHLGESPYWDGYTFSGIPVKDGTYFYMLTIVATNEILYRGSVRVMR